jgi:hypothetical protein
LNFASSKAGTLGTPTVGEFKNNRGEFFDRLNLQGSGLMSETMKRTRTGRPLKFS